MAVSLPPPPPLPTSTSNIHEAATISGSKAGGEARKPHVGKGVHRQAAQQVQLAEQKENPCR